MLVKDIMIRDLIAAEEDTMIFDVLETMVRHSFSGVAVVDDKNTLIGFITEKDIMNAIMPAGINTALAMSLPDFDILYEKLKKISKNYVKDFMNTNPVFVMENDTLMYLGNVMIKRNIKLFPVVNNDKKLVGYVGRVGLLDAILKQIDKSEE
jgi:CBS domain-containing protein